MSNFEEVCLLSCESWVDSFPDEIQKHKFSKKHTEKMKEIFQTDTKENKYKLSKKTIKILLIAAILLSLATTVFAIPACREFIVEKFSYHSEYNVVDTSDAKNVTSLKLNYIPVGFEKTEEYISNDFYIENYKNIDKSFTVQKCELSTNIGFDTEKYNSENIRINGIDAVYYRSDCEEKGIIFNNGEYIYIISGNIDKKGLVDIAQNVE
ncbi:DUF4367 domain-containing protein [Eubacterium coprostanoligenes]|uniref:DUF4367 domain-containing protein n=1 Tax=Eubacterium coprostanoligenes TaxID=290054 RepID=UPI0023543BCE|nr:DUF4367 domain-containing protein [Eubacterium coprostanoligenes]MCI6254178.1 DUF4367 domain-containing protein [Eubacterium coprostanoligenes]MDY5400918.1 DUF4367 domain-containing protein [Eubacterium coprostanoligenes]